MISQMEEHFPSSKRGQSTEEGFWDVPPASRQLVCTTGDVGRDTGTPASSQIPVSAFFWEKPFLIKLIHNGIFFPGIFGL